MIADEIKVPAKTPDGYCDKVIFSYDVWCLYFKLNNPQNENALSMFGCNFCMINMLFFLHIKCVSCTLLSLFLLTWTCLCKNTYEQLCDFIYCRAVNQMVGSGVQSVKRLPTNSTNDLVSHVNDQTC